MPINSEFYRHLIQLGLLLSRPDRNRTIEAGRNVYFAKPLSRYCSIFAKSCTKKFEICLLLSAKPLSMIFKKPANYQFAGFCSGRSWYAEGNFFDCP